MRRSSVTAAVLAVFGLLGSFLTMPTAQALNSPPAYLHYQNDNSHLCMATAGASLDLNAGIVQVSCDATSPISWIAYYYSAVGAYQLVNSRSQLCLSPAGGSTGLNVGLVQYTCDNDPSRYWTFSPTTSQTTTGSLQVRNLHSGLCTSPAGGSVNTNVTLVQYSCDGTTARTWKTFVPAHIQSSNAGGLCLNISGGSTTPNVSAVMNGCSTTTVALWHLLPIGSDNSSTFYLQNPGSVLCLSPAAGSTGVNVGIVQYYCDSDPARAWRMVISSSGQIQLQNVKSGLCLSPACGSTAYNAATVQYYCDLDPSRVWKLLDV